MSFFSIISISAKSVNVGVDGDISNALNQLPDYNNSINLEEGIYSTPGKNYNITINKNVTFNRKGSKTIIKGDGTKGLFTISSGNKITFINVTFLNGYRAQPGGQNGAIYLKTGSNLSSLNFINCIFINNTAEQVRAIFTQDGNNHQVSICEFINNSPINGGTDGAICIFTVNLTVKDSKFVNNKGPENGAIHAGHTNLNIPPAELKIINCNFDNNSATAIGYQTIGGSIHSDINLSVVNFTFKNSKAGRGGVIYTERDVKVEIINSTFINNKVTFAAGGAITNNKGHGLKILNSTFNKNFGLNESYGGSVANYHANNVQIKNYKFNENYLNSNDSLGEAIYNSGNNTVISNSDFNNNFTDLVGGAIANEKEII
ncbi:hypothetical protein ALNOE001_05420 [Candidatus Methanobinarius endosymbioticus]|uniref:Right handed beta helix domain-containing protein n=1 Tax=Candidatus Methanobinarius endosymbioticus TaxID=2006182 RepID=A0A366MEI6_9EURY|nr:hypothetical protein ALNOE001_05420 [Candidatus Methanobinarius endosymbioticus]